MNAAVPLAASHRRTVPFPRFFVHALMNELQVGVGSNLLIVGPTFAPLVNRFRNLGIDVTYAHSLKTIERVREGDTGLFQSALTAESVVSPIPAGNPFAQPTLTEVVAMLHLEGRLVVVALEEGGRPGSTTGSHLRDQLQQFGDVQSRQHPGPLRRLFFGSPNRYTSLTLTVDGTAIPVPDELDAAA